MGHAKKAVKLLTIALENLENVYGDARVFGGMGHPLGLVLCSMLAYLCENLSYFAASFRFCRKFEDFWKTFPFPSLDPLLTKCVFGDNGILTGVLNSPKVRSMYQSSASSAVDSWLSRSKLLLYYCNYCIIVIIFMIF
jgi:hypothetical protein